MELGEQGAGSLTDPRKRMVRFDNGPWHGHWYQSGSYLCVFWHYLGLEERVGRSAKCYTLIPRTASYQRGDGAWYEVLSPCIA